MKRTTACLLFAALPFGTLGCVSELGTDDGGDPGSSTGGATGPGSGGVVGTGGMLTAGDGGATSTGGTFVAGDGGAPPVGSGGAGLGTGGAGFGTGGADVGTGGMDVGTGGSGRTELTVDVVYGLMCADCHGETGDGVDGKGPDIKHPVRDYSEWVIRNGRGEADDAYGVFSLLYDEDMIAHSETMLTDDMMMQIFDMLDAQPQPTTGQGLYEDYCAACHGADGQGGMTDRPITMETHEVMDKGRNGAHLGEYDNRHEYMPAFSSDVLSDAELQMIIDYILTL